MASGNNSAMSHGHPNGSPPTGWSQSPPPMSAQQPVTMRSGNLRILQLEADNQGLMARMTQLESRFNQVQAGAFTQKAQIEQLMEMLAQQDTNLEMLMEERRKRIELRAAKIAANETNGASGLNTPSVPNTPGIVDALSGANAVPLNGAPLKGANAVPLPQTKRLAPKSTDGVEGATTTDAEKKEFVSDLDNLVHDPNPTARTTEPQNPQVAPHIAEPVAPPVKLSSASAPKGKKSVSPQKPNKASKSGLPPKHNKAAKPPPELAARVTRPGQGSPMNDTNGVSRMKEAGRGRQTERQMHDTVRIKSEMHPEDLHPLARRDREFSPLSARRHIRRTPSPPRHRSPQPHYYSPHQSSRYRSRSPLRVPRSEYRSRSPRPYEPRRFSPSQDRHPSRSRSPSRKEFNPPRFPRNGPNGHAVNYCTNCTRYHGKPCNRTCLGCGSEGHVIDSCKRPTGTRQPQDFCYNCRKYHPGKCPYTTPQGACTNCKNFHQKPCKFPCKYCNSPGHVLAECPQKEALGGY